MSVTYGQRFLVIYSGVLTIAFGVLVLAGFRKSQTSFDEISVHRLNVVEPDGTLRMALSDQARFPGTFVKGTEYPHPERKAAGLLFYNNEGTETGGLIYGSFLDAAGKLEEANVHLSFDQYMQDQVFSIDAGQESTGKTSALRINDVGDFSVIEAIHANQRISKLPKEQHEAEWKKFFEGHPEDHSRILLGRVQDSSAVLQLKDPQGRDRIILKVGPDGSPSIQLLDAAGHVAREVTAFKDR